MLKPLIQSVLGLLLKERERLETQLRAVTAALAAFGKSRATQANHLSCRAQANRCSAAGAMGEVPGCKEEIDSAAPYVGLPQR
jgi:hypothetical protein